MVLHLFRLFSALVRRINLYMAYAAGLGILLMGFILFYEVIARYVLDSPTVWSQEVSLYIFIWSMLASAGYTLIAGKHIAIDVVTGKMSPFMQRVCVLLSSLGGLAFSLVITWQAWEMLEKTVRYNRHSPTLLNIPLWTVHSAVLVGFGLLAVQYLCIILERCGAAALPHCKESNEDKGGTAC